MSEEEQFHWPDNWKVALDAVRRSVRAEGIQLGVNEHDIEDVYQQVCLRAHMEAVKDLRDHKSGRFENLRRLCGWAKVVAARIIYRQNEQKSRALPASPDIAQPDPLSQDFAIEEHIALVKGTREQRALRLFALDEPFSSIGRTLGVSKTQASNLVHAALAQLRRRITK